MHSQPAISMPTLQTKINRLEQKIRDLQFHLDEMKRKKMAHAFKDTPEKFERAVPPCSVEVIFDGGTSCNIPKKGFGHGYGSYKNGSGEIKRVKFGIGHSCNSAEIRTLEAALDDLSFNHPDPSSLNIVIRGDSKIALRWANPKFKNEPAASSWREFHTAIAMLRVHLPKFKSITRIWHPREESVKLFGH